MKKVIALLLAVVMLLALVGCGGKTNEDPSAAPETPTNGETQQNSESANDNQTNTGTLEPFDAFPRPRVVKEGLTVGYVHTRSESESQSRTIQQYKIEAGHRGWNLVDAYYENDQECRDGILNLINQDVDAIILFSMESMASKVDLIAQAREKGIGVYCNDNQVVEGIIANSSMPNGVAAMELLYTIGEEHYWKDQICVLGSSAVQSHNERVEPIMAIAEVYPEMNWLAYEDITPTGDPAQVTWDYTQAWLQKYGDQMTGIVGSCDFIALAAAEAIAQNGDPTGEKCWTAGLDGGSRAWAYIRDNTPFRYNYAQPFEAYTHNIMELIGQIQQDGLNPGDEGCLISVVGECIYANGRVVTRENVPAVGESIHAVFDYYGGDPADPNAWYNWTDAGGAMTITDGAE